MKKSVIWLTCLCAMALAAIALLWSKSDLGVKRTDIEQDARSKQQIPESWGVTKDVGDCMAALIFYNADKNDFTISIYIAQSEASDRYQHRFGGNSSMVGTGVVEYTFEDCSEQAFISLNTQQASKAEIYSAAGVETRNLDADKPFALVLDKGITEVIFYDMAGNIAGDYEIAKEE